MYIVLRCNVLKKKSQKSNFGSITTKQDGHFADGYTLNISIIALFPGHKNYSLRHNFAEAGKKHRYI